MGATTRRLVIGLSISVALNLFLLGFMSARGLGSRDDHHRHHRRGPDAAQPLDRAGGPRMPGARGPRAGGPPGMQAERMMRMARRMGLGEQAQAVLKERRAAMRERHKGLRAARKAVAHAMAAEPFDAAALEAAFAAQRQAHGAAQEAAHATMVALAGQLDADARRRLMRERPGWGRGKGKGMGMGMGPDGGLRQR